MDNAGINPNVHLRGDDSWPYSHPKEKHQARTCNRSGGRIRGDVKHVPSCPDTLTARLSIMLRKHEQIEMLNDGYIWSVENEVENDEELY